MFLSVGPVMPHLAHANPQGGEVAVGGATIQQTSPTRVDVIQTTDRVVIDWRSFSIGAGEHTNFQQPSSSATAYNRVIGNDLSVIAGRLTANGNIILMNQNGIRFTGSAIVDVNSLVATTSRLSVPDFMAGRFNFTPGDNPSAFVVNEGTISVAEGGLAAFVSPFVSNSGLIQARLGRVELASGTMFTIDTYGDRLIQLAVPEQVMASAATPEAMPDDSRVSNSGRITADGGSVVMSVANLEGVVNNIINMDGIVQARAVDTTGGKIVLKGGDSGTVQVAGTLDASGYQSGAMGGEVKILGDKVALQDGATVDASGAAGGGTVLVGGNYQGKGPEQNAKRTFVATAAAIKADATEAGDGGKVVVWSDQVTGFKGTISARGGAAGGNGGLAEVSGKELLAYVGTADLSAPNGTNGTILLDPGTLNIDAVGTDDAEISDQLILAAEGGLATFSISAAEIVTQMNTATVQLAASVDINVQTAVNGAAATSGNGLSLTAPTINFSDGANIATNAGDITLSGDVFLADGATVALSTGAGGGNIAVLAGGASGDINGNAGVGLENLTFTAGTGTVSVAGAVGNVTALNSLTVASGSDAAFNGVAAGGVSLTADAIDVGDVATTGAAGQTYTGATTFGGTYTTAGNDFSVTGSTTLGADTTVTTAGGAIAFNGGGSTIDSAANQDRALALDAGGGDVTLDGDIGGAANGELGAFSATTTGTGTIAAHDVTTDGSGAASGNQTFAADAAGGVSFSSTYTTNGGDFSVTAPTVLNDDTTVATSGGDIAFNGATSTVDSAAGLDRALTLTADGGNVTLDGAVGGAANGELGAFDVSTSGTGTIATHDIATDGSGAASGDQSYFAESTGGVSFNGAYATNGGAVTVIAPVIVADDTTVTTSGGDIAFIAGFSTINSAANQFRSLALDAGGGGVSLDGAVGLGANGALGAFSATTSGAGQITVLNVATDGSGAASGDQTYTSGSGGIFLDGNYLTGGGDFSAVGRTVLTGDSAVTTAGGSIDFSDQVSSANLLFATLSLDAGGGDIDVHGLVGSAIANESMGEVSFVTSGTGQIGLAGVSTDNQNGKSGDQTLTVGAAGQIGLSRHGVAVYETFTDPFGTGAFTVNGPVVLDNNAIVMTGAGDATFNGSIDSAPGLFRTFHLQSDMGGDLTVTGAVGANSPLGRVFASTFALGGAVTFGDVATERNLAANPAASGDQIFRSNGGAPITLGGTYATAGGDFDVTGPTVLDIDTTVATGGGNIAFNGAASTVDSAATLDRTLALDAGGGDVTLDGDAGGTANGALGSFGATTSGTGAIATKNMTTDGSGAASGDQTFTTAAAGGATLDGDHVTNGGAFSVTAPTTLGGDTGVTTSGGNIAFNGATSTIDSAATQDSTLALDAGGGNVTLDGDAGGAVDGELGSLSATSAGAGTIAVQDVTTDGSGAASGDQTYTSVAGTSVDGDYATNGGIFTINGPAVLAGNTVVDTTGTPDGMLTFNGTLNGPFDLTLLAGASFITLGDSASLATLTAIGAVVTTQTVTTTGNQFFAGVVELDDIYDTNGGDFIVTVPVTITGDTRVNSMGGLISFAGDINSSPGGLFDVALDAAGGNILIGGNVGTAAGGALGSFSAVTNGNGQVSLLSVTTAENGAAGTTGDQTYTVDPAGRINLNGQYATNGGMFTLNGLTSLAGDASVNTTGGTADGNATFNNDISGGHSLTVASSAGDTDFNSTIGANGRVTGVTVASAANLDFDAAVDVAGGGMNIAAGTVDILGPVSSTGGGGVTIANSGLLTIAAAATMTLDGAFLQSGTGPIATAANMTTTNDDITFNGAVTLTGPVTFDTGPGIGDVTFNSTLGGAQNLVLTTNGGNITFNGNVGSPAQPVTDITITNAHDVTNNAKIFVDTFTQTFGDGRTDFKDGAITATGDVYVYTDTIAGTVITRAFTTQLFANTIDHVTMDVDTFKLAGWNALRATFHSLPTAAVVGPRAAVIAYLRFSNVRHYRGSDPAPPYTWENDFHIFDTYDNDPDPRFGGSTLTPIDLNTVRTNGSALIAAACGGDAQSVTASGGTPGDAAFNTDSTAVPFSTDAFCGGYPVAVADGGAAPAYGGLTFVTHTFWTDFAQSGAVVPLPDIRPAFGLAPR